MQKKGVLTIPPFKPKYTLYITITTFKPGVKGVNDHNTQNSAVINAFKTTKINYLYLQFYLQK
uniref:Uncharacterized protein n=1 Tax=Anguilla anguilla TaxID=7936 RepID=A0A0E9VX30_ANGAN